MSEKVCRVCDTPNMCLAWTDSHGIAQCVHCGAPYRIFHYEGEGEERRRVDKPALCLFDNDELPFWRRCWSETKARLSASSLALSFPGGYDVATESDRRLVSNWWKQNKTAADVPESVR